MEESLKKATTEMMILHILGEEETYIGRAVQEISRRTDGKLSIVFPYAAIYRLLDDGYIEECKKRVAPDGRRRQYLRITEPGKKYLADLEETYHWFIQAVEEVLTKGER